MNPGNATLGRGGSAADPKDAMRLFGLLYGARSGFVGVFSTFRSSPGDKRTIAHRPAFFASPDGVEEAVRWLLFESERGREAYFCPHLLLNRRRIKENAAPVAALWADCDGGAPSPGSAGDAPEPTAIVETSPGKRHLFWRLTRPVDPPRAEALNRRLARAFGADPSGWDLSQLLRPPGTRNRKYEGAPPVSLLKLDGGTVYHPRELDLCLPAEPAAPPRPRSVPRRGRGGVVPAGSRTVDLSRLTDKMRVIITTGDAGLYRSRSEADFAACLAMFGAGYSEDDVWAVLTDPAHEISRKYLEKGPHGHSYLALTIGKAKATATPAGPPRRTGARRRGARSATRSHRPRRSKKWR